MSIDFQNPIIPGFSPDPSVVFVESEDAYFLVNSSFHVFPGLPIYTSKNLKDWTLIGNVINRQSQLSLRGSAASVVSLGENDTLVAAGGLFAPTIRWHKGIFYVVCTNYARDEPYDSQCQNFYVTTSDIWSGEWSDPIYFDFRGIDPSFFFDDDDRVYIQGSYRDGPLHVLNCTIRQFEIDIATGKPLSEIKHIWDGYAGTGTAEGPHLYKKDGCYYLVTAEGGTFEDHMIAIARSTGDVWGPYETASCNPLLTAAGKDEEVRHSGHGELFQGRDSSWWCVCLGIRYNQGSYPMGRETFLTPVTWPVGDWPQIPHPQVSVAQYAIAPTDADTSPLETTGSASLIYLRDAHLADYAISGEIITMDASQIGLSSTSASPSFIGRRQRQLTDVAIVALQLPSSDRKVEAGLTVFKDEYRHLDIYYESASASVVLRSAHLQKVQPKVEIVAKVPVSSAYDGKLWLQIKSDLERYTFSFATKVSEWSAVGSVPSKTFGEKDFTGTIFGVYATKDAQSHSVEKVTFEGFKVQSKSV